MADKGKRGDDGNTKIWISWEKEKAFRWNKKHFKGYYLLIKKNSWHKLEWLYEPVIRKV